MWSQRVDWEVEFRCFALDGQVLALSSYWRGEVSSLTDEGVYEASEGETEAAFALATPVLRRGDLPRAVVVDVGRLHSGNWAVIEANPAFGAGLYGCDADRVLEVVAGCVV